MQVILEHERRALGWTAGQVVTLADGSDWHLPRFDLALLATQPELVDEIRRVVALATQLARLDRDSPDEDDLADITFDQYATLAGRLLRLNYELAIDEWDEVLSSHRGEWFADLVCKLGDAIVLAIVEDWRGLAFPFLADHHDAVLSN